MNIHCVKSIHIQSFSGPFFLTFGLNADRMQENTDQKTSQYGHFSRSGRRDCSIVFFAKPFVTLNTPFFYKQFIFDPRPENYLSFSRKSPQKIV